MYLSVAMWLFAGINKEDFSVDVINEGEVLLFKVKWCEAMRNLLKMHGMKLKGLDGSPKITQYHPQIESFIEPLLIMSQGEEGNIIPFAVESRFHLQFLQ